MGGVKRGAFAECPAPDSPWILWKKQLALVEAKHTMQAEALRQVRQSRALGRAGLGCA